jgi:hypothetical protein
VILAGVDVRPTNDSPRAIVAMTGLRSGEVSTPTLRLPASAMRMVNSSGEQTAMTHLFVALDFADEVVEIDELNNLAIVEAAALEAARQ